MHQEKPENRLRTACSPRSGVEPPPEYRWKKGQSGNPGGRPKTKFLSDAIWEALAELRQKKRKT